MEQLSNDHEDGPNQQENSLSSLTLLESQWKLRQQLDQYFTIGKAFVKQIVGSEAGNKSKKNRTVRVTVRDPSRKVNHLSKVI